MAKESEKNFKGMNWLTGRKIYLSPKEEAIIKEQNRKGYKIIWWALGIFVAFVIFLFYFGQ